jgi:hypothetical protein
MKKSLIILGALLSNVFILAGQATPSKEYMDSYQQIINRTQWWREARFGMFIHFGAYAVAGRGEWVKSNDRLTTEQYQNILMPLIRLISMQKHGPKPQKQQE